ncbi:hypothetical protein D6089_23060 [Vibrio vulnificus]|nr:hypothetical protein [Vibrio vulnificus]EGR1514656.1 hypothetical protein [Vibrio vulnificus]ELI0351420.1 hypothetical protein [Vibrio vulnificus]MCU8225633.1 hypothetical protein [Vibrio vulnificus]
MRALWNSYFFILIPFIMLCIIKGQTGKWENVILSTDWSVASFIMFAQKFGEMISALVNTRGRIDSDVLTTYIIKVLFLGIIPSVYVYFIMNTEPNFYAAGLQILLFVYASWRFFIDSMKISLLQKGS